MSICIYTGGAADVADVIRLTPGGTIEAGDIFNVLIDDALVSVAATLTTVAQTCLDLLAALQASTSPEFVSITWAVDNATTPTYVYGTGPSDGRPIYASLSVTTTEAGGGAADAQTFAKSHTTTGTGSKYWSNVSNWSGGAVPVSTDIVYIGNYGITPQYDIDQNAVTLAELHIVAGATSGLTIGLPKTNVDGYVEYLNRYLKISATLVYYGEGTGASTPKLNLDTGTNAATVQVLKSDSRSNGDAPFQWTGNHASNVVNDCRGALDIGWEPSDSGQATSVTVGRNGSIRVGKSLTVTTVVGNGGNYEFLSDTPPTTITVRADCTLLAEGTGGTVTTLLQEIGSFVDWRRPGTVTTINLSGAIEFANDDRTGKTFTNVNLFGGAIWNNPNKVITKTNGIILNKCGIEDVTINEGKGITLTVS